MIYDPSGALPGVRHNTRQLFSATGTDKLLDLNAAPYGGARFYLAAGIGDAVIDPHETIQCRDWLELAGIATSAVRLIAREQHLPERPTHTRSLGALRTAE
jgi:hypothetical protein